MKYPPVDIVDEHDNVIGAAMVADVWKNGYRHRGVFILLEDEQGRLLLQKRAPDMLAYPNCWDVSAGGHVDTGMTYEEAARAELAEELGLYDVPLTLVGKYYEESEMPQNRRANVFFSVYRARVNDIPAKLAADEVSEVRWFTRQQLEDLLTHHPEEVALGLQRVYRHAIA